MMGQPVLSHLHHRCRRRPAGLTARVRPEGGSPYALALTVVWKAVECKVVPLHPGAKGQTRAEVSSSSAEANPVIPKAQVSEKDGEISCSVEETNRIRAQLGLKPLRVGKAAETGEAPPLVSLAHSLWFEPA